MGILNNKLFVALACFSALVGTGCAKGQKSAVTSVGLSSDMIAGEQHAGVDVQFETKGMQMPTIVLPIFNPISGINYGSVSLLNVGPALAEVKVEVNLTSIAQLPAGSPILPNGTMVPVSNLANLHLLSIPVPTTSFVIYLALHVDVLHPEVDPVLMVGIAMPFPAFDPMGEKMGTANIFIPFGFAGIEGTAGVFAGKEKGKSGFAIFVDASGLLANIQPKPTPAPSALMEMANSPAVVRTKLEFLEQSPGAVQKAQMGAELSKLAKKHTQLTL